MGAGLRRSFIGGGAGLRRSKSGGKRSTRKTKAGKKSRKGGKKSKKTASRRMKKGGRQVNMGDLPDRGDCVKKGALGLTTYKYDSYEPSDGYGQAKIIVADKDGKLTRSDMNQWNFCNLRGGKKSRKTASRRRNRTRKH